MGKPEDPRPNELPPELAPPAPRTALEEAVTLAPDTSPDTPAIPKSPRVPPEFATPIGPDAMMDLLLEIRAGVQRTNSTVAALGVQVNTLATQVRGVMAEDGARHHAALVARDAALAAADKASALDIAVGAAFGELSERVDGVAEALGSVKDTVEGIDRKLFGTAHSAMSAHDAVGRIERRLNSIHALGVAAAGPEASARIAESESNTDERAEAGQ